MTPGCGRQRQTVTGYYSFFRMENKENTASYFHKLVEPLCTVRLMSLICQTNKKF